MARFLAGVIEGVRLERDRTASSKPFTAPFPPRGQSAFLVRRLRWSSGSAAMICGAGRAGLPRV